MIIRLKRVEIPVGLMKLIMKDIVESSGALGAKDELIVLSHGVGQLLGR